MCIHFSSLCFLFHFSSFSPYFVEFLKQNIKFLKPNVEFLKGVIIRCDHVISNLFEKGEKIYENSVSLVNKIAT